jgi:ATP-dependent 26S proteasome regulatory subunit
LKNAFFDMQFNFIKRSETVDDLLAWNTDVRKQLDKDVIEFLNVMPILRKNGLPNSRGIILSGPPGTGKTMIAKSLAAKSNVTTILISAEMINQKNEVKSIFRLGRKLAPTLMIIEDIDTAGTVSRRFTDHPILGEYLQAMDGMEPNNGMVIIATTNHTENIDPAISDRPGRFDRIIDVPLPNFAQRIGIISNILGKMPTEEISESEISKVANSSSGLSGAWIREIVQTAMIEAIYAGREKVSAADLELGLNDVLARRGLAYQSTPNLSSEIKSKNAEVYTH